MIKLGELPPAGWLKVWRGTIVVSLVAAMLSVAVSEGIMLVISQGMNIEGCIAAFLLPLLLGSPMVFYQLLRSEQLRVANQKLEVLASTDWLTTCLNRRAFTGMVNAHLDSDAEAGALLVIDADHFKQINDRYGHERGDEVLQLLAETIRANVRDGDLVGRIGGEEFAVLLKGAGLDTAQQVAERIRRAINALHLHFEPAEAPLSVSIGGASFDAAIGFAELFRAADQRLYGAKHSGRNRIDIAPAAVGPALSVVA